MTLAENFERQSFPRYIKEKDPRFLQIDNSAIECAVLFHVLMGKGKTTQIRGILERHERSLILTHKTTLTGDIYANSRATMDLKHYAIDFPSRETKALMGGANKLICQLESIHYLQGAAPYTYLTIDEFQILFMQAASKTFKDTKEVQVMWEVLSSLIKSAKYVRLYDGFMGRTSSDVLKSLWHTRRSRCAHAGLYSQQRPDYDLAVRPPNR